MSSVVRSKRSPSQFATWLDCPRKWAFSRVLPGKPNRFAELGTRVHASLEAWLRDGVELPDTVEGAIAMSGLPHLPEPGTAIVESGFSFDRDAWIAHGFRDFVVPNDYGAVPVVGDHKTTTDLKWAKTPEDLAQDPQGTIYAASAMIEFGADVVDLLWVYYQTREPYRSKPVRLRIYEDEVARRLEEFDAIALEMQDVSDAPIKEIKYNGNACDKYGGCPYVVECGLTSAERFGSIMIQSTLKEKLDERMKAKQATQSPKEEQKAAPSPASALASRLRKASSVEETKPAVETITVPVAESATVVETAKPDPVVVLAERTVREDVLPERQVARSIQILDDVPNARDVFAARAASGILSNPARTHWDPDQVATEAFALADAMIKARG